MQKDKNGKVTASLTEVKNKTGDIFDLVDEFGEVVLTSYNKPRYKITKIGITETINLDPEKQEEQKTNPVNAIAQKVQNIIVRKQDEPVADPTLVSAELLEKLSKVTWWDSKGKLEKAYAEKIQKTLL